MSGIAIIGFQGRFPGHAKSPFEFFDQLLAADCFCGDIPADRWSRAKYVNKGMAAGKTPTGRGSFLDYDYRGFDPDILALSMPRAQPRSRRLGASSMALRVSLAAINSVSVCARSCAAARRLASILSEY
jgi:hypothetical protein